MFTNTLKTKSASSTSLRSARRQTLSKPSTPSVLDTSFPKRALVESELSDSSSLDELYGRAEFRRGWDNDVSFQVAQNAYHLRQHRGMKQGDVAAAMGTSQSAIARIEGGDENITLSTLKRLITALRGRLHLSFPPEEDDLTLPYVWWRPRESDSSTSTWTLRWIGQKQDDRENLLGIIFTQPNTLPKAEFVPSADAN